MITDDQVWSVFEAVKHEALCWRVMDFNGRGAVAVRYGNLALTYLPIGYEQTSETFEKLDFRDADQASEYVQWRAIKAALEKHIDCQHRDR
jgi:hypothetical protein